MLEQVVLLAKDAFEVGALKMAQTLKEMGTLNVPDSQLVLLAAVLAMEWEQRHKKGLDS